MKFLILALALLPSLALAEARHEVVKQLDGKMGLCSTELHLGNSAYLPKSLRVVQNNGTAEVQLEVAFLTCAKLGGAFAWAPRNPQTPVERIAPNGKKVRSILRDQEFMLLAPASRFTSVQPISGETSQTARFTVVPGSSLEPVQKTMLGHGFPVRERYEFFTRAVVTDVVDGQEIQLGLRTGGAYSLFLTLQRQNGELHLIDAGF